MLEQKNTSLKDKVFSCCSNNSIKYTILGALFGLCFPIAAEIIHIYYGGLTLSFNVGMSQEDSALHWIIYTAPIFLGLFAHFIGRRQDRIIHLNQNLEKTIVERTEELEYSNLKLRNKIKEHKRATRIFGESTKQLNPKIDMILSVEDTENITLPDLFYLEKLQRFQDSFAGAFGLSSIITDPDGNPITEPSNYNQYCDSFQHSEYGEEHCFNIYEVVGNEAVETGRPISKECNNCGLTHAGAPIVIGGKHIATWIIGHCKTNKNKLIVSEELLEKTGVDKNDLETEFGKAPIISEERFEMILDLLTNFTEELSSLGYGNLQLARDLVRRHKIEKEYADANHQLKAKEEELIASNMQLESANQQLKANEHELKASNMQLESAFQQLKENEQELKASNMQLESAFQQLKANEQELIITNIQLTSNEELLSTTNQELITANKEISEKEERIRKQHTAILKIDSNDDVIAGNITEAAQFVTEIGTETLDVDRVSIWLIKDDGVKYLECLDLFERDENKHSEGTVLNTEDYPLYYEALESGRAIDASDAVNDPRTSEFGEGYLKPLGITSMLDGAIRVGGKIVGVVCCESIGETRNWDAENVSFVGELADQLAQVMIVVERKYAENQLRIFRKFADDSTLGCAMADTEGNLVYANSAIRGIFGFNAHDDIIGKRAIDFYPVEYRSKLKSKVLYSVLKSGQWVDEIELIHQNGSTTVASQSVFLIRDNDGNPQYFASIVSDVTGKIRAEKKQNELKEKLEKAERMESLGVLAGGVAHDLNNMLGPLVGYPEIILRMIDDDNPIKKKVERMGKAARDAADVISDLLSLARRGRYEMHPLSLVDVVKEYLDSPSFIKLAELNPDIQLKLKLPENIGNIQGSAPHLSKVVMNLIVNAYDAMQDGGELILEISQMNIDKLISGFIDIVEGDYVVIRVKDNGQGIELENINKIFEPYYSSKKMGGSSGSGLGLSVVYGIIKDHKGYYDVFSRIGAGTEFVFYFPLIKETVLRQSVDGVEIGGSETILIVDDVEEQREVASELLSSLGYKTSVAQNGHEAVDILKKKNFDLILLDMIMEDGFDGLDTYQEIHKFKPNQKAIIVSGYSSTERVQIMQKLGAGQYIKKPYSLNTISKAVREELDKKLTPIRK